MDYLSLMRDPLADVIGGSTDSALVALSQPGGNDEIRAYALAEMERRAELDGGAAERYARALAALAFHRGA